MIDRLVVFAENKYTRLVLVGLVFLSLQTTIFNDMRPFGVCLQVMVLLAAASGLARGSEAGAIAGFIIGLLYDMVLTTPMGLCAAVFAVIGYVAGLAHSFVHEPTWWSRMLLGAFASAVGMILLPAAFTMTGTDGLFTTQIFTVVLVVAVFNALLSVPAVWICRWALRESTVVR
jgi:rod shape-determining protein MreD